MQDQTNDRRWPRIINISFVLIVVLAFFGFNLFTVQVEQHEKAAVFFGGKPIEDLEKPGLYFMPFWYSVTKLENRGILYDSDPRETITLDKKTLVTDDFAIWRIGDPTMFIQAVTSEVAAFTRIDDNVYSRLNAAFGERNQIDIVVTQREAIFQNVTTGAQAALAEIGIDLQLVLVNRVELAAENKESAYQRMQAERQQTAQTYRSEGKESAQNITSTADKDVAVLLADANSEAAVIRGKADAEAAEIYADAYSANPEFYSLVRGLEAAETALGPNSGTDLRLVLTGKESLLQSLLK